MNRRSICLIALHIAEFEQIFPDMLSGPNDVYCFKRLDLAFATQTNVFRVPS